MNIICYDLILLTIAQSLELEKEFDDNIYDDVVYNVT